jgi:hypothetical protein
MIGYTPLHIRRKETTMDSKKTANQLLNELMRQEQIAAMSQEDQRKMYQLIHEVMMTAKMEVIADAENAIAGLRVFSLR